MKLKESSWKNRPKKARDILIVLVVFAVALISFLSLIANVDLSGTTMKYEERYIELSDNWTYTTREGANIVTSLPVWVDLKANQVAVVSHVIPEMDSPYYTFVT